MCIRDRGERDLCEVQDDDEKYLKQKNVNFSNRNRYSLKNGKMDLMSRFATRSKNVFFDSSLRVITGTKDVGHITGRIDLSLSGHNVTPTDRTGERSPGQVALTSKRDIDHSFN
eukprot:TRINITY_DN22662_c0_g1_i2.p1 TRINITY_DN22662_c0_g1~~TRINITY_DN22662_c0_g1_i2.p1  ORF type:complete len:124 (+),score=18.10 TRINITY_DN22662_c0_g1_i2:31-372(+)